MEKKLGAEYRALDDHPLYKLDTALLNYFGLLLTRSIGEPFREYFSQRELLAVEEANEFNKQRVADISLMADRAWETLEEEVPHEQLELCLFFRAVFDEWYELRSTAAALEAAEEEGDTELVKTLRLALEMERNEVPGWWSGKRWFGRAHDTVPKFL